MKLFDTLYLYVLYCFDEQSFTRLPRVGSQKAPPPEEGI